jgi:glutamine amidotransferase
LIPLLNWKVLDQKTLVLGICLGMQLLTRRSEEGRLPGLGWIDAETVRFRLSADSPLRVPHMGWNYVEPKSRPELWLGLERPRYYFVHSYHVRCRHERNVLAVADHGGEFVAGVCNENILGTQFHPEKSHRFGMTFLRNLVGGVANASSARHAMPAT